MHGILNSNARGFVRQMTDIETPTPRDLVYSTLIAVGTNRLFVQGLEGETTRPINENSSITSATAGYRVPVTFL